MRDDEIRQRLRDRNPWWRAIAGGGGDLAWTQTDTALRGAARSGLTYEPPILNDVVEGGLYVLRGPRRVGKSVVLKRYAAQSLRSGAVSPSRLIYLGLDEFDARSLRRALRIGRDLTASVGLGPRTWLLDEITAVDGWTAVLKSARDETAFADDTVIATGSSAHGLTDARRALGAGRTGRARHPFRTLLPMSFRDFARARNLALPEIPVLPPSAVQSEDARDALLTLQPFVDEIDLAWQAYCEIGGFPRAVADYVSSGEVSDTFANDLVHWLAPDVTPDDLPESVVRLLSGFSVRTGSPLNMTATAESIGLTRERLRTRLNRLTTTFAAFICPQIANDGAPVPSSRSKVYLLDPLLMRLPALTEVGLPVADMTQATEAAIAMALARASEGLHPERLVEGRAVGYVRTGSGGEVDFGPTSISVAGEQTRTVPVESKWVSRGWRADARAIEGRYQAGILATKDVLDLQHPAWAVPAGALALLLA